MIHDYEYYPVAKRFQDKTTKEMSLELTMDQLKESLKRNKHFESRPKVQEIIKKMVSEGLIKENITVTYTWRT